MDSFNTLMPDQSVTRLGLSRRAENALVRNGILTIWDLQNLATEDVYNLRGIGTTCANEIIRLGFLGGNAPSFEITERPTITEYIEQLSVGKETMERNYRMFEYYYNNYPKSTYDELADREKITRSRAGQIISRMLNIVAGLVRKRQVNSDFLQLAIEYAKNTTRIDSATMNADKGLNGTALAIIASEVIPEQVAIYGNPRYLNHRWIVVDKDQTNASLEALIDYLTESSTTHNINALSESLKLSKALILDIRNIAVDGEEITLKGNHSARGDTGEELVEKYLEKVNGPANITDIANDTGRTINQIRSYVGRMNSVENVGQSVYVLKDDRFEGQSVVELVKKYLLAVKRPAMISKVVSYVQKYRNIPEESIRYVLFSPNSIFEKRHSYMKIWIRGMSYQKTDDSRNYDIQIENAVLWIFNNSDDPLNKEDVAKRIKATFGNKTTHNITSIYTVIRKLTDKEVLRRVGDYNSGLYMKSRDFGDQVLNDHQIINDFSYFEANYPYREKEASGEENSVDATPGAKSEGPRGNSEPQALTSFSDDDFSVFLKKNVGDYISFRYKGRYEHNWNKWRNARLTRYNSKYFWCMDSTKNRDVAYCRDKVLEFRSFFDTGNRDKFSNLGGWQKDIADCVNGIKGDEFVLADIYKSINALRHRHPNNNNLEQKIRQQLQILVDKGYILSLGNGRYRKLK